MTSGDLIKEARLRAGLTQAELAGRLAKSQPEIGRWERGEVQPSFETLRRVIGACGLALQLRLTVADDSDLSLIDQMLSLTPAQRFEHAMQRARFRGRRDRARSPG